MVISTFGFGVGIGPLLAIGHWALSCHAVGVADQQTGNARVVHGAASGNGGSHGTARSYTVDAPCTAQKTVAQRRIGGGEK